MRRVACGSSEAASLAGVIGAWAGIEGGSWNGLVPGRVAAFASPESASPRPSTSVGGEGVIFGPLSRQPEQVAANCRKSRSLERKKTRGVSIVTEDRSKMQVSLLHMRLCPERGIESSSIVTFPNIEVEHFS